LQLISATESLPTAAVPQKANLRLPSFDKTSAFDNAESVQVDISNGSNENCIGNSIDSEIRLLGSDSMRGTMGGLDSVRLEPRVLPNPGLIEFFRNLTSNSGTININISYS
jgi:hypothetical protein